MQYRTVLIVEDNALVALDLEQTLLEAAYRVCGIAATEWHAVELARQHRPDFAVVDINLAEGNGISAALQISKETGAWILFTTAHCDELASVAPVLDAHCVNKPYQPEIVVETFDVIRRSALEGKPAALPKPVSHIGG